MSSNLKLKFDKNQDYQLKAINSIVDIFEGQERRKSLFSAVKDELDIGATCEQEGVGNKLDLKDTDILDNLHKIQLKNGLTKSIKGEIEPPYNFSVEMETGTGKTYVFTRTIFELNAEYGFRKFIIVVPSVAIREGIKKSLEITEGHFKDLYPGVGFNSFIYDSSKFGEVREFATSNDIQIMIINIDAFRKDFDEDDKGKANLIYKSSEQLSGKKPIELIQQTNPIVIIDEPQSVDNTERSKEAIEKLNPLCILRYSATHKKIQNLVYRLDPVDAFEKKLVKKIEVWSVTPEEDFNTPYIKVLDVYNKNGVYADLELDIKGINGKIQRKKKRIKTHNELDKVTKRDLYKGFNISSLNYDPNNKGVIFENDITLKVGETIGDINNDEIKYQQIKATIKAHLDKELSLIKKDIKVLSLFFIDEVKNYQIYNDDKTITKGKYQIMFEKAYKELISKPKYKPLLNSKIRNIIDAEKVKGAYFAEDANNKGKLKDSKERKSGFSADDIKAFDLIMKRKELLLSFDSSVRFIFSHSALKEGWDNPNVFQICTLVDNKDSFTKRQKIGRGLRLAVNQDGERVSHQKDETVNVLTVIANESYEEFAFTLQSEIQEECGIKFGHLEENSFQNIIINRNGEDEQLGYESSKEIFDYMVSKDYLKGTGPNKGMINECLKRAVVDENVEVPVQYEDIKVEITDLIKKVARRLPIGNNKDKVLVKSRKEVLLSPEFEELWRRIKQKTTYRVKFDDDRFVKLCLEKMNELKYRRSKVNIDRVDIEIKRQGIDVEYKDTIKQDLKQKNYKLPDLIREIQDDTMITRSTIIDILIKADKWDLFKLNPHQFIKKIIKIFNSVKREIIVEGIKYEKINDNYLQSQLNIESDEDAIIGYLEKNAIATKDDDAKSLYTHILYDSDVEKEFVKRLEKDEYVKLYVKLPGWFVVDTPVGDYNPDWAILMDKDGEKKLYFVVETKGSLEDEDLRGREKSKIRCAKKHFNALESGVQYEVATDFDEIKENI